jgi:hypothetical protein
MGDAAERAGIGLSDDPESVRGVAFTSKTTEKVKAHAAACGKPLFPDKAQLSRRRFDELRISRTGLFWCHRCPCGEALKIKCLGRVDPEPDENGFRKMRNSQGFSLKGEQTNTIFRIYGGATFSEMERSIGRFGTFVGGSEGLAGDDSIVSELVPSTCGRLHSGVGTCVYCLGVQGESPQRLGTGAVENGDPLFFYRGKGSSDWGWRAVRRGEGP